MVEIPVAAPAGPIRLEAEAALRPGVAAAIVCHPHPAFGGRMDTPFVVTLAEALRARGLSTVRFNFRGLGRSTGTPTGGLAEHEDVRAVIDWALAAGAPRVGLVGYSFGALMAARAVAEQAPVAALAAVGFPSTIVGDAPERLADVARALDRGVPWLFVHGDRDPFCELERLRGWAAGRSHVVLEERRGEGHFFGGEAAEALAGRVARFIEGAV